MLVNILRFLLLTIYILGTNSENSKSCLEYPLGPPVNFQASIDATQIITLTWEPPEHYHSCDVQYLLHLKNSNTSEYLTDVQQTNNLMFKFSYENHVCIAFTAYVYATYEGLTSASSIASIALLDPLTELEAPLQLLLENSEETLKLEWLTPPGYEKCTNNLLFQFDLKQIEQNITIYSVRQLRALQFTYTYGNSQFYCDKAAINLSVYFSGRTSDTISKTFTYGPKGYC